MKIPQELLTFAVLLFSALSIQYISRSAFNQYGTVLIQSSEVEIKKNSFDEQIFAASAQLDSEKINALIKSFPPSSYSIKKNFYIDRCKVRQSEFLEFLKWIEVNLDEELYRHPDEPINYSYGSSTANNRILSELNAPVSGVSYFEAWRYCREAGGRLPTSQEWMAASTGKEGRLYPWGQDFKSAPWEFDIPETGAASSCEEFPETQTNEGVNELSTKTSEWTVQLTPRSKDENIQAEADTMLSAESLTNEVMLGDPTLSGGNAYEEPHNITSMSFYRRLENPTFKDKGTGFRCVYEEIPDAIPWKNEEPSTVEISKGQYFSPIPEDSTMAKLLSTLNESDFKNLPSLYDKAISASNFKISRHEVSVWEYMFFLYDPLTIAGLFDNSLMPNDHSHIPHDWSEQWKTPFAPVHGVSWWSAYAFARRVGGRLPTELEWESAYTSNLLRKYSWGNADEPERAITREWGNYNPMNASINTGDITPEGVLNLAGNVSEWTSSYAVENQVIGFVAKGGNYILPFDNSVGKSEFKRIIPSSVKDPGTGIRVVYDP